MLTSYKSDIVSDEYWQELAKTNDTLVFYMSSETLDNVIENLVKYGIGADKLLAVVEQATTPLQNVHISSLYDYKFKGRAFVSPSIVIIGKVVALHQKYKWLQNSDTNEHYFKPIELNTNPVKAALYVG